MLEERIKRSAKTRPATAPSKVSPDTDKAKLAKGNAKRCSKIHRNATSVISVTQQSTERILDIAKQYSRTPLQ